MKTLTLFDQNLGLTPFEKFQTFDFFNFYYLQKALFFFPRISWNNFPCLFCVELKDVKMDNFWPKPWTNPFRQIMIFRLFELLVFIVYNSFLIFQENRETTVWPFCFYIPERRFSFLEYCETYFPGFFCLKHKDVKIITFWPKPWE